MYHASVPGYAISARSRLFELRWIRTRPDIQSFDSLDRKLDYNEELSPSAPAPERFGWRDGLRAVGVHVPKEKERVRAALSQDVLQAVNASYAKKEEAPDMWLAVITKSRDHKISIRPAIEQPARGHATAIEALVHSEDWKSMAIMRDLPRGRYAQGRVVRGSTSADDVRSTEWFGAAKNDLAHGPVIDFWNDMGGHYRKGFPHGVCTYGMAKTEATHSRPAGAFFKAKSDKQSERLMYSGYAPHTSGDNMPGRLDIQYAAGVRGDAVYTAQNEEESIRIEGSWVGEGYKGMPENAVCAYTGPQESFEGKIFVEALQFGGARITRSDGVSTMLNGSGLTFEGSFQVSGEQPNSHCGYERVGPRLLSADGTLTLPKSEKPHEGSDKVASGHVRGVWKDNEFMRGEGDITLHDGTRYVGNFGQDGMPHGQGALSWANGVCYAGTFVGGYLQDRGTLTWADGQSMVGTFYRTPTWMHDSAYRTCDVAFGDSRGARFALDEHGRPDRATLISLGLTIDSNAI